MTRKFFGVFVFLFAALILSMGAISTGLAQNGPIEEPPEDTSAEDASSLLESLFGPSDFEPDLEEIAKHALGAKGNPVRCNRPGGERAYLDRLRCQNGRKSKYSRIGSFGGGPYGNILDGYDVKCRGADSVTIFMDMYHPG